ncbi:MAG: hypothetical protein L0332_18860 [Chloroflexi bacterium]|nr:hypothetical protein [Chloroflexota bacterium]MCI0644552.1 hypothetical protein [Chloroflexota bacterium]MCI0728759.1 hypothetical protein [Chloroflexota bacterium]
MNADRPYFDEETWTSLPAFFERLPEPVRLHIWGDETATPAEAQAARLVQTLAMHFPAIQFQLFPRRANYSFYPVIGVMGLQEGEPVDYGVRLIGLPAGVQMTSLVAAIQCVSFRGMTSEARTRIHLSRLRHEVKLEIITTADNETGALMAQRAFNMAVASPLVRSYLIMGDAFPEAFVRYSIRELPHLIINGRVHLSGVVDEETLLRHMTTAVKQN